MATSVLRGNWRSHAYCGSESSATSDATAEVPPSHQCPPKRPREPLAGLRVTLSEVHCCGKTAIAKLSRCHKPSLAYKRPNRAQSRAVACMRAPPMKVPLVSSSITALRMPMTSNSCRRGKLQYA